MTDRLLASIEALAIDPPGTRVTFVDRLAAENGWTRVHAAAVTREYRRFLYLAATATEPVTPSDAVDQAWHLHLSYTRSYWDDLCGRVLGRPLHHQPTQGGPQEAVRYRRQYAATLARYAHMFGALPPGAVWPTAAKRFAGSFVRADRTRSWIVSRRRVALSMLPIGGVLSMAATADPPSIVMPALIIVALVVLGLGLWRSRNAKRRDGDGDGGVDGGDGDGGGCGGCGGD
jgi:uncharacterized membrane protein YgcG